jgi:hypothetical protein
MFIQFTVHESRVIFGWLLLAVEPSQTDKSKQLPASCNIAKCHAVAGMHNVLDS